MFHYTSCGLEDIWLRNGYTEIDTEYGKSVSIHDIEGLHRAIGNCLINDKPKLTGAELRFLRKELDLSQIHLANLLGVSESSMRSWENDRASCPLPAEKVIRLMYEEKINGDKGINDLLERLSQLNRDIYSNKITLEETKTGWKQAA